ncbi:MAG: hypothetical protein KJO55_04125, partial [Gammaproteobacteria bacterium]|nr:hypothetical protein [Gammaproteobacteria bacterium]
MSLSMKQLWLALGVSMLLPAAHGTVYDRGDAMWRAAPLEMRWQAELSRNDSRAEMVRAWHAAIDDSVAVMTVSQRGTPPLSFHAVNAYSGLYQTEHAGWLDFANIAVDGLVMRGSSATGCCSRLSAQRSWIVATGLDPAAMQRLFATAGVAAHPYLLLL